VDGTSKTEGPDRVNDLTAIASAAPRHLAADQAEAGAKGVPGAAARPTLAFLGDVMLGRDISQALRHRPPEWFWGDALPLLRGTDAVLANLESPITTADARWRETWKLYHFRASPEAVRILTTANVRFVCLANNHMLDFRERGLLDTIAALDAAGICHAGAGRTGAEAAATALLALPRLSVGLFAATDNMPEFAAGEASAGTNHTRFRANSAGLAWVERSVAALRQAGARLIVLSLHWGPNLRLRPSRSFRAFAHAAIERGVDVIHGHSAHVVQAIERHGSGVILYDAGNFIDDYWRVPFRRTTWSFVFLLELEGDRPARLRLVPIQVHHSPLRIATGPTFQAMTGNMKALCEPFGTSFQETAEGLALELD
jgi:poly-gamma-glutamate synthesis protein (capsule biosynthesis protein)